MTIHQSSTLWDCTWNNWKISKNSATISPLPPTIPQNGIINRNACSNNQNIPCQSIYQQLIFFLINYCFQRFQLPKNSKPKSNLYINGLENLYEMSLRGEFRNVTLDLNNYFLLSSSVVGEEKKISKIHHKSKCNCQNKMSNLKKKKSTQLKICQKIFRKNVHVYDSSILRKCLFLFFLFLLQDAWSACV